MCQKGKNSANAGKNGKSSNDDRDNKEDKDNNQLSSLTKHVLSQDYLLPTGCLSWNVATNLIHFTHLLGNCCGINLISSKYPIFHDISKYLYILYLMNRSVAVYCRTADIRLCVNNHVKLL